MFYYNNIFNCEFLIQGKICTTFSNSVYSKKSMKKVKRQRIQNYRSIIIKCIYTLYMYMYLTSMISAWKIENTVQRQIAILKLKIL